MAPPRQPRTGEEAEKYAAEHLHSLGWPDAAPSGSADAADIDIIGGRPAKVVVAQVVLTRSPTEARSVCAVRGAGYAYDARTIALFSRAGFTGDAVEWADKVRVALFEFAAIILGLVFFNASVASRSASSSAVAEKTSKSSPRG